PMLMLASLMSMMMIGSLFMGGDVSIDDDQDDQDDQDQFARDGNNDQGFFDLLDFEARDASVVQDDDNDTDDNVDEDDGDDDLFGRDWGAGSVLDTMSSTVSLNADALDRAGPTLAGSAPTEAGTPTDDRIMGDDTDDIIHGGDGFDEIAGRDGDDVIYGQDGVDDIHGEDGDDQLYGGADTDFLSGEDGDDWLDGGAAGDHIFGYNGDDRLMGGTGNDELIGGQGDDVMLAGDGDDTVQGGHGNDTLSGDLGTDTMMGGKGDDLLIGRLNGADGTDGDSRDYMNGGYGDDILILGQDDMASGGEGADSFVVAQQAGEIHSHILDFDAAEDDIVIMYTSDDSAPEVTLVAADDDPSKVMVHIDGAVVAAVSGGADLTVDDLTLINTQDLTPNLFDPRV
ncbi:MAG: calcium-binding protein, partial [Pseudomonadota bacterium]